MFENNVIGRGALASQMLACLVSNRSCLSRARTSRSADQFNFSTIGPRWMSCAGGEQGAALLHLVVSLEALSSFGDSVFALSVSTLRSWDLVMDFETTLGFGLQEEESVMGTACL